MLAAQQPEAVLKLVREFVLEDQADGGPAG
jgi:hypothetical protein